MPLAYQTITDLSLQLPLFVYGTLLPGERNYPRFLAGRTQSETPASVSGELWWVAEEDYPYLCRGDELIHGYLVSIVDQFYSATVRAIDLLEDFHPDHPSASLYQRRSIEVVNPPGRELAWTYFWTDRQRPGIKLTTGDFSARWQNSKG